MPPPSLRKEEGKRRRKEEGGSLGREGEKERDGMENRSLVVTHTKAVATLILNQALYYYYAYRFYDGAWATTTRVSGYVKRHYYGDGGLATTFCRRCIFSSGPDLSLQFRHITAPLFQENWKEGRKYFVAVYHGLRSARTGGVGIQPEGFA